jgi:hypothetical protein
LKLRLQYWIYNPIIFCKGHHKYKNPVSKKEFSNNNIKTYTAKIKRKNNNNNNNNSAKRRRLNNTRKNNK